MKRMLIGLGLAVVLIIVLTGVCYILVSVNASGRTYDDVKSVPCQEYGLLLGTSPLNSFGLPNRSYENRIAATVALYKAGKIKRIIASGGVYTDRGEYGFDEPAHMRADLVSRGVPDSVIIPDPQGVRTLQSMRKAREQYGIDSLMVISQRYHNERAIYQADHLGLKAIGFNAVNTPDFFFRMKNYGREMLARVKLFIDLYLKK